MRYVVAIALILTHATPVLAQNGKFNVTPPQPYTRADFTNDCIKMADTLPASQRANWVKRCTQHEAP